MGKTLKMKICGRDSELKFPTRERSVYIFGCDSYIGQHITRCWHSHGYKVFGCGKNDNNSEIPFYAYMKYDSPEWHIPDVKYSWLLFCHDPHDGYDQHITLLRKFCEQLKTLPGKWRVMYPSSVMICHRTRGTIKEQDPLIPHNRLEMAVVSAENWLQTYTYETRGSIVPFIFRFGDLYGSELHHSQPTGLVSVLMDKALHGQVLPIPCLGDQYRTLLHINDACESAVAIMESDLPPQCINIPGESRRIIEMITLLTEKYHLKTRITRGDELNDDFSIYTGDRKTSRTFFAHIVDYKPKHSFKKWLQTVCDQLSADQEY